jgi:hypothetical protein
MGPTHADSLVRAPRGRICPVCGKASYSLGGIHPQCSQSQADEKTAVRLRAARKKAAEKAAEKAATAAAAGK